MWSGRVDALGYGRCQCFGEAVAQRVAWRFRHGAAPEGRLMNECGNRLCVEPGHWRDAGAEVLVDPETDLSLRRAEIYRLWDEGLTQAEIVERVGCARSTVWRHLRDRR